MPSYGWPNFTLRGKIMPLLERFEFGQKLGF